MKKTLLPLIALAAMHTANAQMKEGKVVYESVQQLNFQFRGADPEMAKLIPKTQTKQYELLFANNQSLWQPLPDINAEANQMNAPGGGPTMNFVRIGGADAVMYHNFETGKRVSERELSAKTYIVEENIDKLNWKLTDESKVILGHKAFKATTERYSMRTMMTMENGAMSRKQVPDTSRITAWFAADIPVPAGPDFQGQLPGLILVLDVNNGRLVYTAIELSPKVNASKIKQPNRGKKISAEDFAKEQQKMMDQMQQRMQRPGNGERVTITSQQ